MFYIRTAVRCVVLKVLCIHVFVFNVDPRIFNIRNFVSYVDALITLCKYYKKNQPYNNYKQLGYLYKRVQINQLSVLYQLVQLIQTLDTETRK